MTMVSESLPGVKETVKASLFVVKFAAVAPTLIVTGMVSLATNWVICPWATVVSFSV